MSGIEVMDFRVVVVSLLVIIGIIIHFVLVGG